MKDWDYSYLADMVLDPKPLSGAARAEIAVTISRMSKEIQRLQALVYLKPSEIQMFGKYRMFRTDDEDNREGVLCLITQGTDNNFYLILDGTPSSVQCQNVLTLDEQVRFQKV